MSLTHVEIQGVTFVRDESLTNKKYALRYRGSGEIHVSPAVFALLHTELAALLHTLEVRDIPGRRRPKLAYSPKRGT